LHDLYASLALAGWLVISFLFDVSLTFIQARHCSQLKFCPRVGCECCLVVEYIGRAFVVVCMCMSMCTCVTCTSVCWL
jgi:hypothetical protein